MLATCSTNRRNFRHSTNGVLDMEKLCKLYHDSLRHGCYINPSRYVRKKQARDFREYARELRELYMVEKVKYDKPEPKKNRPYYRALENKKWRF